MASLQTPPTTTAAPQRAGQKAPEPHPAPAGKVEAKAEAKPAQALVPAPPPPVEEEEELLKGPAARLPVELDVAVPVEEFRVRNLLALEPGNVIATQWSYGEDVPLAAGEVQLAWSEFEVIDNQLAVRITRLP